MNRRLLKVRLATSVFIVIMVFGYIPQAVWAGQVLQQEEPLFRDPLETYDIDPVYIFYDPGSELLRTIAENVHEVLAFRLDNIEMRPIKSWDVLEHELREEPWIAVYALRSHLKGVQFADANVTWATFYDLLSNHRMTQHIVGMGNTLGMEPFLALSDSNIRTSEAEQVDGLLLAFFDMWALHEAVATKSHISKDYENAAGDLRTIALQIYADNFNMFFKRSIEPINPVGEFDEEDRDRRTEEMWDRHAPTIEPAFYHMDDNGSLIELEEEELPADFSPAIKISTAEEVASSDYILGEIPLLSALRGPIGEIIDVLLSVLGGSGSTVISIPTDLIETIKGLFEVLEPIIGIVKDFDLESPLKSIVQAIANEFPFMAEFKDYLNVILKALFNFRGDIESIVGIIGELVSAILPDSVPQLVKDFINQILGAESGLVDIISNIVSEGKGVFDAIFSFFTKNTLRAFLNKTLTAGLGMTEIPAATLLTRVISFVEGIVDYITGKDFVKFIETIGTDLLGSILSVTGMEDAVDKIMSIVKMGMSAFDLLDEFDTTSFLQFGIDMLEEIIGPSNIPGGAQDLAQQMLGVVKSFQEGAFSDINGFRTQISDILNSATTGVTQAIKDVVRDAMTMLTGFFNGAFDKNSLPDLFEIAANLVNEVIGGGGAAQVIDALNSLVKPVMGFIALVSDSDALKEMISKTVSNFVSELGDIPTLIKTVIEYLDVEDAIPFSYNGDVLNTAGEIINGILMMIQGIKGQSFQGIMQSVLMAAGSLIGSLPAFDDVPIDAFLKLLQSFFPDAFGISKENMPSSMEVISDILEYAEGLLGSGFTEEMLEDTLEFFMDIKDIFTGGVKWLLGKVFDWLSGLLNPVLEDIENTIEGLFEGLDDLLGFSGEFPIGLGDWSLFTLEYALGIKANFAIDLNPIFDMIVSMIFDAREVFSMDNIGDFFKTIFSFFEISPQFYAELGIGGFDTEKNALMKTMLTTLGLKLSFEGSAKFVVNLFTFRGGMFEWDNFFKIVEWGLHIKIHIGKVFTLLDFLTAGVGGGALNAVAEFLGLDMITVEVYFEIALDIVKKAATAVAAEVSSMTLTITFGVALHIPIDLLIVAIIIDGSLEIILSFFQDFASPAPMKITLRLIFTLKIKFRFLMFEDSATFTWEPGGPWDLSPSQGDTEYNSSGVGFDTDGDGLGDPFEDETPGLDKFKADTDGDGANDKLEFQTMGTDHANPDSDGDGLLDGHEWDIGTNPMREDTDWDDVDDYMEVEVYGTNPLEQDTDGDGLTDAYEIYTKLDLSNVTPTVTEVIIGGESYNDRTDPLNPDTDGDNIKDGDEGPMGAFYGDPSLYNDTEDEDTDTGYASDPNPLIFNGGFTHPLDADTDDDSALQLYNGIVDSQAYLYLWDMNDGAEIAGFWIILYDEEGEPERKKVFTNPCNPDTDGDTGITDRTPMPGMWLNSDGYELAQTPQTDPTDGDTDDDGLLDGIEGVLNPYSNHTNPTDPDTDDDGLFDMQEILLGADPRRQDTDGDMVNDGDEFYVFFTNPNLWDTDFDGLGDGEEVYIWHSNPLLDDSDSDRILDGDEVLMYGSDPMDEDSDNDGLTDFEEIMIHYTDPFTYDTDGDGLSDGEEVKVYDCDPLNWDTDGDSIKEPNEYGEMTFPLNDYQEAMGFYIYKLMPNGTMYQQWVYTGITETDTDEDGLTDAMELYLASGLVPWLDPIPLDPTNKDTDHDLISDGSELAIVNVSGLIYPYRAMTIEYRFNTSPVDRDSDNDTLIDYQEVMVFNTNPANNDTDNDTILDWNEVWVYNTSALHNDTDGDGLYDFEETLVEVWPYGPWPPTNWSTGMGTEELSALAGQVEYNLADIMQMILYLPSQDTYPTLATDPDCDDDWLPDGAEVNFYHSDPLNEDSDGDGTPDTLEFDTDFDGLPDGIEFQLELYRTGGGIFDQDSDGDGISDGDEYYLYGTDPSKPDTDGDGYPDGLEIYIGTNPTENTTESDFEEAIAWARGEAAMDILMPLAVVDNARTVDVNVLNYTSFKSMKFRYNTTTGWSENYTMTYNPATMTWVYTDMEWEIGDYMIQVFAIDYEDQLYVAQRAFTVAATPTYPEPINPLIYLAAGIGIGMFLILFLLYGLPLIMRYVRARRETGAAEKPPDEKPPPDVSSEKTTKKKSASTKKKSTKKGGGSARGKLLSFLFIGVFLVSALSIVPAVSLYGNDRAIDQLGEIPADLIPKIENALAGGASAGDIQNYPADQDIGLILGDRVNDYKLNYEPWRSKAAIHAIAYDEGTGFLAMGGGYLYDNEIHLFRMNTETGQFDKVWDIGDSVLQSDVMSLDFGDTDLNNLIEIVAGCSDGHVYVFEQRHLYDPYANTENQFDLVWTSPSMFRVFALKIADVDRDYRPDIVAGGWDGKLHLFEYDNHSGYPFVEEHWIDYREVATLDVGEKIYSLETGDTNYNGLPEIIVGTREGTVYVYENDGITIMVNGQPFPLIYDNHYYLNWTSENYTWTPIQSMAVGELDGTPGDEIALVAQGQGVMILDWNTWRKTYDYTKVYREFEPWETFGFWQLDNYVDRMVYAHNVTYHDPVNPSIIENEPIQYVWNEILEIFEPDASVYPYNSGMAGPVHLPGGGIDANFSNFNAFLVGVDNATAILDFGLDEEGTGGANAGNDLYIWFEGGTDLSHLQYDFWFSISQDGTDWELISHDHFHPLFNIAGVDVDDALSRRRWDWFRYVKIMVNNSAYYRVNGIELVNVWNTLVDALSVTIGPLRMDAQKYLNSEFEQDKILVGSVTGEFNAIAWNETSGKYEVWWDSGDDDFYTFGENIWDIEYIGSENSETPIWLKMKELWMPPDTGLEYVDWTWGILDPFNGIYGSSTPIHLMGTDFYAVRAYTDYGDFDPVLNSYIAPINTFVNTLYEQTTVTIVDLKTEYTANPMIVLGGFNPSWPIDGIGGIRGGLHFFYRTDYTSQFQFRKSIYDVDQSGEISRLVSAAKAAPRTDFADVDGDGDLDMILSLGYVYLCRNLFEEIGVANFTLVHGYFDAINSKETSKVWGRPEMFDIDGDGDHDIILSYHNSMGATCWLNEGTDHEPVWEEDKRLFSNPDLETNMKFQNLTAVQIIPHGYGYHLEDYYNWLGEPIPGDYSMVAYNTWTEHLWWSIAAYDASDSYLVATYPKAAQMDFSLLRPEDPYYNIGYHIHETWSNEFDLEDWTLSIASGDIDGDGMGEIIVGDYDNNVYAFEHLGNNTYKRMFRTFDLNHTEVTDISPYLYEELEGISGDFNRRIWDHAEHLVVDVDLDQDGLKELIVSSGLQFYVFEDKGLFGGDELSFVYSMDLRDTEWYESAALAKYTITAMAAGADLDYNGEMELAVAAGAYVFVFNVPIGGFDGMEANDYFVTDLGLGGRYFLIGNPGGALGFSRAQINAMTLCDTDKDGYRELIIGGISNDRLRYKHGFLFIYECQGGTFYNAWQAPEEVWYWNPISDVTLDDQDYDGNWEIIIGHTNGFDIWEHIPGTDSEYQKVEYVTANPNYPIIPLSTIRVPPSEPYSMGTYGHFQKDVVRMSGAYENLSYTLYENGNEVWLKGYLIEADFWSPGAPITNYISYPSVTVSYEWAPTITEVTITNGYEHDLWFAWEVRSDTAVHYICFVMYDMSLGSWSTPYLLQDAGGINFVRRYSPCVFEYSETHMGVAYMYDSAVEGGGNVGVFIMAKDFSGFPAAAPFDFQSEDEFIVHDVSAARLWDGTVAIAMSAINAYTSKLDYDVWVVVGNEENNFTLSVPHQATTSYHEDMYVDIEYLRSPDQSIVVVYEQVDALPEERLMMVASTTKGRTWNVPEALNYIPDYVNRAEAATGSLYYVNTTSGLLLWSVCAYAPAVMPLREAGFMYLSTFIGSSIIEINFNDRMIQLLLPQPDILHGFNLQSDWTGNWLRDVVDLDVGDTDSDGRREVVVGFEDQVGVYEMKHSNNGTDFMSYEEAWLSGPYENDVTGVTVSDSNNNGWDDIGVSTRHGDVYFIEYVDPSESSIDLWYSTQAWTYQSPSDMTYMPWNDLMDSYDIDADGYDEVIVAHTGTNQVFALHPDGTIWWEFTDSTAGFNSLLLSDLNNDTIPEVLAPCNDTTLYVLDITNGNLLWKYDDPTSQLLAVTTGDIFGDGLPEVVVTDYDGDVWILNSTGALLNYEDVDTVPLVHPIVGNFMNDTQPQIAFVTCDSLLFGSITVMNPLNGTIYYQEFGASTTCNLLAADFNDDGYEDLIFTTLWMHILDVNSSTVYYNSTFKGFTNGLFMDDFDGDNIVEILIGTFYSGVYLEEVYSGVTQWHYDLRPAWDVNRIVGIWDMDVGHIGGSGLTDVVIAGGLYERFPVQTSLGIGVTVAIDGKNGVPKWFNYSDGVYTEVVAARLPYSQNDSAVAWDFVNDDIVASHGVEPTQAPDIEMFPIHEMYWSQEIPSIKRTYTKDLNGDDIDEIIIVQKFGHVSVWDAVLGTMVWNRTMEGEIQQVRFGNIDGNRDLDVVVQYDSLHVEVLEGENGNSIQRYNAAGNYETVDFLIADFDQSAANLYEEIAVLYHEFVAPYNTYIQWYDETSTDLYPSTITWADPSTSFYWDKGFLNGNPVPEIAVADQNSGNILVFRADGTYIAFYGLSGDCAGLQMGYLFTDAYEILVWKDTDDDLKWLDHIGGGSGGLAFSTGYVRSWHLVNLNQSDTLDELVVNLKNAGVVAYDYYGNVDWIYRAPLVLDGNSAYSIFRDANSDGQMDVIFTNFDYINVVDGGTARLLWHFKDPDQRRIAYPSVGAFYEAKQMDVVYIAPNEIRLVAHSLNPPAIPAGYASAQDDFVERFILTLSYGSLMAIVLLVPAIRLYRRREELE